MDSSAIVCMADQLAPVDDAHGRLSTISFYDQTEPHWDDHLYFSVVERLRGKQGVHIPASASSRTFAMSPFPYPLPGADSGSIERERRFEQAVGPGKVRVILAGHGGDELLGGRPDPIPELADDLVGLHL